MSVDTTPDDEGFIPGLHAYHDAGFTEFPTELWGVETLTVRCLTSEYEPELCDGWEQTFDVDPADIRLDGAGLIHFENDAIPSECPECGNPHHFEYNGLEVNRNV